MNTSHVSDSLTRCLFSPSQAQGHFCREAWKHLFGLTVIGLIGLAGCASTERSSLTCDDLGSASAACVRTITGNSLDYSELAFADSGDLVALGFSAERFNPKTSMVIDDCEDCDSLSPGLHHMAFDGERAVAVSTSGFVYFGASPDGVETVFRENDAVNDLVFQPSTNLVIVARDSGVYWHNLDGSLQHSLEQEDSPTALAVAPGGDELLLGLASGRVLWVDESRPSPSPRQEGAITALAFTNDGGRVVSGTADGDVLIADATTAQEMSRSRRFEGAVTSITALADGSVAITSLDGSFAILDSMGEPVGTGQVSIGVPLWSSAINADGTRLALGSGFTVNSISQRVPTSVLLQHTPNIRDGSLWLFDYQLLIADR